MKKNLESCIEIYITNECNLTCSNCNRFNNYDFQGHYHWKDNANAIEAWSKRITAPIVTIIGGEPSLHPELQQWTEGIASAWPDVPVMIQSNGLIPVVNFPWWNTSCKKFPNIGNGIAVHSTKLNKVLPKKWNINGGFFDAWEFTECAVVDQGDYFDVRNSDPESAFAYCSMKHSHTIFQGKLYKCPTTAVLPKFAKQYSVNLSTVQQNLLDQYQALEPNCSDQDLENFINTRHSSIPQCSLCPDRGESSIITFDPNRKKHKKNC